ncbi:hypothetical protein [Streptomyces sp. NPDC007088]|uniref:hypothetical protein n=1 Tax=Streptomyces sp. NPDC007088 TaxID=3364773 RepID=UPI003674C4D0
MTPPKGPPAGLIVVGALLRALRLRYGRHTPAELSVLGYPEADLDAIEAGAKAIAVETAKAHADMYGVPQGPLREALVTLAEKSSWQPASLVDDQPGWSDRLLALATTAQSARVHVQHLPASLATVDALLASMHRPTPLPLIAAEWPLQSTTWLLPSTIIENLCAVPGVDQRRLVADQLRHLHQLVATEQADVRLVDTPLPPRTRVVADARIGGQAVCVRQQEHNAHYASGYHATWERDLLAAVYTKASSREHTLSVLASGADALSTEDS